MLASRGLSTVIPGLVVLAVILVSTLLLTARILDVVERTSPRRVEVGVAEVLRVIEARYTEDPGGPSLSIALANAGSTTVTDLDKLEVIVSYKSSNVSLVELLRFANSANWTPGYWSVANIRVGGYNFTYESHPYLRPGEVADIVAFLSHKPDQGSLIVVAVISPRGAKAEYSTAR